MPRRKRAKTAYYAHTLPGLENIAWEEIEDHLPGVEYQGTKIVAGKNGLVFFNYGGQIDDLLDLRTTEDIFAIVKEERVGWGYEGLSAGYNALLKSDVFDRLPLPPGSRRHGRKVRFRVITRIAGQRQPYRRSDMQKSVEKAIEKGTSRTWKSTRREGTEDIEIWANMIGRDLVVGLRISDASMRHRDYKEVHLPASLRPTLAAAMVWLSQPRDGDVFMDPMCGVGTIIIERAIMARYQQIVGGDSDVAAVRATVENIGPKHKPRQIFHWDATQLPLESESIDCVVTNLPWGVRVGRPQDAPGLYERFFGELDRVLSPRGRAVVLSTQRRLIRDLLRDRPALRVANEHAVDVLGRGARIIVIERRLG
jgi:23S rRNA G2445 N2-methylase RlmL